MIVTGFCVAAVLVSSGRAGGASQDEISAYIEALGDHARREVAQDRLWEAGEAAVPALRKALLTHREPKVREGAARVLGRIRASEAAGDLAKALEDPGSAVRVAAGLALSEIAEETILPELARASRHPDAATRAAAAFALGHVKGDLALLLLAALARDESGEVRSKAAAALGQSGDEQVAPLLVWLALKDNHVETRALAAGAVGELGATGAALALADGLSDKETLVQSYTVRALRTLTEKRFGFSAHASQDLKGRARRKWLSFLKEERARYGTLSPTRSPELETKESTWGDGAVMPVSVHKRGRIPVHVKAREYYNLGAVHHRLGNTREAMALYQEALDLDSRLGPANAATGLVLLAEGLPEGALARFERALSSDSKSARYWANMSRAQSALGRREEALKSAGKAWGFLDATETRDRQYVSSVVLRAALDAGEQTLADDVTRSWGGKVPEGLGSLYGAFLFMSGLEQSAWRELQAAGEAGTLEAHGRIALARCLLSMGKKEEARDLAVELASEADAKVATRCAEVLVETGAVLEAEVILNAVSDPQVPDIEARLVRVSLLIARHDAEGAVALALNLADIKRDRRTLSALGDALAALGDVEGALTMYREALKHAEGGNTERAVTGIVRIELARDGHGPAIAVLKQELADAPLLNMRLLALLARAFSMAGRAHDAAEAATAALRESLGLGPLYLQAAHSWDGAGESDLAMAMLQEYARNIPESRSFAALARYLATCEDSRLRNEEDALFFADLALEGKADAAALLDASSAFAAIGKTDRAIEALREAARLEPDNERVKAALSAYLEQEALREENDGEQQDGENGK